MAPTRMKLRVRRRDNAASGGPQVEEESGRREGGASGGRRRSSRIPPAAAPAAASPPAAAASPPAAAASARVSASEEASPDSKCPICLDRFNNLAFLDRCLHRFCFPCIQEWSHNKAECPLCKQPFASILHSVRAEDDFVEYTLRPPPAAGSVAATVAMVAAMASAARSSHQMRLMLRRRRRRENEGDGGELRRRRRRERRGSGASGAAPAPGVWEWYLDSPPQPLPPPPPPHPSASPLLMQTEEGAELRGGEGAVERGVIFEGLEGAVAPLAPDDRASRRLMVRLAARRRLQREGGAVRPLRERETVFLRRALYRCGVRVHGVAGDHGQQQCDVTAESFRQSPALLNRLRPWLRRELTVLYGAHGSLVEIVQRLITARLTRHGLEDTPTIEEELRPFLLARTEHFLHELLSFARSPLGLDAYDLHAVYEPPPAAAHADWISSSSSSSVIAISEGEEAEEGAGPHDDIIQTGSCLSLSGWDDETPGPSYSTAEPSCSLASFSPAPQEPSNQEAAGKPEEECLIVGYKKPMAERTPELVQLSSDSEEEKKEATPPPRPPATPPHSHLPTGPASSSAVCREEEIESACIKDIEEAGPRPRAGSCSGSSGRSRKSVCTLSSATPTNGEQLQTGWRDAGEEERGRSYPAAAMLRRSSPESQSPTSHAHSSWEGPSSSDSFPSSCSSSSTSSPLFTPPPLSPLTPPPPSCDHHAEKPGGKRKYKSRHLDDAHSDPTWRPRERRRGRGQAQSRKSREENRKSREENRKSREQRSPSVEIVYEGTLTSDPARPPQRKRRRKRRRRTQPSSSPLIITLDSDSSQESVCDLIGCHLPLLPPLPLDLSAASPGGGGAMEVSELPVNILEEAEPATQEAEPPAACWVSSDVDVENVDEDNDAASSSPNRPIRASGGAGPGSISEGSRPIRGQSAQRGASTPDRKLIATILIDLMAATNAGPAHNDPLTNTGHAPKDHLTNTGSAHKDHLTNSGPAHKDLLMNTGPAHLTNTGPAHPTNTGPAHSVHPTNTGPAHSDNLTNISPAYRDHLTNSGPALKDHRTNTGPAHNNEDPEGLAVSPAHTANPSHSLNSFHHASPSHNANTFHLTNSSHLDNSSYLDNSSHLSHLLNPALLANSFNLLGSSHLIKSAHLLNPSHLTNPSHLFNHTLLAKSSPLVSPAHSSLVGQSRDVPPLLRRASPVSSSNRNTPPPLKHKDGGSPRQAPPTDEPDPPYPPKPRPPVSASPTTKPPRDPSDFRPRPSSSVDLLAVHAAAPHSSERDALPVSVNSSSVRHTDSAPRSLNLPSATPTRSSSPPWRPRPSDDFANQRTEFVPMSPPPGPLTSDPPGDLTWNNSGPSPLDRKWNSPTKHPRMTFDLHPSDTRRSAGEPPDARTPNSQPAT